MAELTVDAACHQQQHPTPVDAASLVLSRLPHPDTAAAEDAAFVDAATGRSLSFMALRRGALALASALRLGLGLRRGDAVLILLPSPAGGTKESPLLVPQIVLGVLAAGGVVVAADPDATPAEVSAAAHASGAVIVVAAPEVAASKVTGAGIPLLLTTRSVDPRTVSVEELIEGGDSTAMLDGPPRPSSSDDLAFVAYSSSSAASKKMMAMTHADLIAAVIGASLPGEEGRRVCLASLPVFSSSVHGLPLLALGLPAAGVTTVLTPHLSDDPRAAVAAHGATDVVATPEAAAVLAAPIPLDDRLSSLRRVLIVAPEPLAAEARLQFRRRLPWVGLTELFTTPEDNQTMPASASEQAQMTTTAQLRSPLPVLTQTDAAALKQYGCPSLLIFTGTSSSRQIRCQ